MTVFIAGATGVLGKRVVPALVAKNRKVICLSRSEDNDRFIRQLGGIPRRGNLFDPEEVARWSAGCDAILHLATKIPRKGSPGKKDWAEKDKIRAEAQVSRFFERSKTVGR